MHRGDQRHVGLRLGRKPCRRVQGRSQDTTLSASDLHNARATILFYNMELYKLIKKMRQNTMWIEADILDIHLTPNRYNALAPAIVYVSNDVIIPFNFVTSQSQHKKRCCERTWMWQKSFWNLRIGAPTYLHFFMYKGSRANTWMFDVVYNKGNQMKLIR